MADEITPEKIMIAVKELRSEMDKKMPDTGKLEKINDFLDKQEEISQALTKRNGEIDKEAKELKERLEGLEVELSRKGGKGDGVNYKEMAEYKTLNQWCKDGTDTITQEEMKTLRTDSDVAGGFLVHPEFDTVITKKITEISDIRSIARVRTISAKSLEMPVRATLPESRYEGEGELGLDSTSTYSSETVTAFRHTFSTPITQDMLMDAAFDMETEIVGDAAEAFAQKEGALFINGTGHKQPAGYLQDARITDSARESQVSATLDADDILLLTGDLKTGYNPTYTLNRRTLAFLRTLKSTTGQFLWMPGLNGVVSNSLAGFPYLIANDMPDIAVNAFPVAFGDFFRGYVIVDRSGTSIIRDQFTLKKQAIVEFTMNRWNTGQVILPEAIKVIKVKP